MGDVIACIPGFRLAEAIAIDESSAVLEPEAKVLLECADPCVRNSSKARHG